MTQRIDRHSSAVFIIAATPFTEQGALDLDSTDRLIDFYLEKGVTGMTILGILIPVSLFLGLVGLLAFLWSLKSNQYDDMEGNAARILFDEKDRPDS